MIHRFALSVVTILYVVLLSSCSNVSVGRNANLVDDLYYHARHGDTKDSVTAFILLSNIALTQSDIGKIENDYKKSTDKIQRYYYAYLLAKRTQEEKYIASFINATEKDLSFLIKNDSRWVSIGSPFYDLISFYSRTNDEALSLLLKLVNRTDGAALSILADDLSEIRKMNPKRFSTVAKDAGVQEKCILKLMDDE